ncbi:hypothetical protein [Labilibacter marinus]|uniref:hypothetical protein n=1 Tax=Labilibacter marinus TaxID=1477105 RepID=UPI0008353101|nr:hypothetical protein [Labilibacter marinus]
MKEVLIIVLLSISLSISSQTKSISKLEVPGLTVKNKSVYSEDSKIKVINKDSITITQSKHSNVAYFINGVFLEGKNIDFNLNPRKIEEIKVEKEPIHIGGIEYEGKILVKTHSSYKPKFITLKKVIDRYLKLNDNPIVFQLDNNVIEADYNSYMVNEDQILKIEFEQIKTSNQNIELNLVKLTSRTKENIKEANTIYIK